MAIIITIVRVAVMENTMEKYQRYDTHLRKQRKTVIICGRKTYDSIPKKPLKDRLNIVISRTILESKDIEENKDFINPGSSIFFNSVNNAHRWLNKHSSYKNWRKYTRWVIGGAQIIPEYLNRNWITRYCHDAAA